MRILPLLPLGLASLGALVPTPLEAGAYPDFPDDPRTYGDAVSLERARALKLPENAPVFRSALRDMSLLPGYFPTFQDPNQGRRRRLPKLDGGDATFDFSTGRWTNPAVEALGDAAGAFEWPTDLWSPGPARTAGALLKGFVTPVTTVAAAEAAAGFPGEVIDEVIVPVPSEIFMVLDKLGKPDWKGQLRAGRRPSLSNRIDVALLLGNVVAEGFVAVQAEDRTAVEQIGKDVLRLAEALGLRETVLPHTNSILEASKHSHWEIVRVELDKTQRTVRDTMEQHRDAELAQCVSLGGWLRGTEAVTDLINKNYTSDSAELLNQPDIIRHFQKELKKLAAKNQKLKNMLAGLEAIASIIGTGDEPPSAGGVQSIHSTAARLVKSIALPSK